jgi:hypothetical protein
VVSLVGSLIEVLLRHIKFPTYVPIVQKMINTFEITNSTTGAS